LLLLAVAPAAAADFLWLSDIHFDPLATPALVDKLAAAEPAHWAEILATGTSQFSSYGHDTNWPLLQSVLQESAKVDPNAPFTLVTGDLVVHHFREHFDAAATKHDDAAYRDFVRKTVEFVGLQLRQHAAGKPVFVALGNNDDTCGDYATQPGGPFLQDTAKVVADLAGLTNTDSYLHLASYSVANPAVKHARIIVLNTIFLSPRYANRCGQSNANVGDELLTWLQKELESAKSHHERVWLMYHIPPGIDAYATTHARLPGTVTLLWKEVYVNKFLTLLGQYPGVVGPNFAGHLHVDDFRLLGQNTKSSPWVIVGPAVSPMTGQNPTFRTVNVDSHGALKDQSTYYLKSLTDPQWQLEYDFAKEFHLKGLNAQTYSLLFSRISNSQGAANQWMPLYSTSHVQSSMTPDNFRAFYCASGNVFAPAYQSCVVAKKGTEHAKTTN
jgi:hypothetical protein